MAKRTTRTPIVGVIERTCRIGVGIKAASHGKVLGEELFALAEALDGSQPQPLLPCIGHLFEDRMFNLTGLLPKRTQIPTALRRR